MRENTYKIIGQFECCGVNMVTVIIENKAACVMRERDYNRIVETERKYRTSNKLRVA